MVTVRVATDPFWAKLAPVYTPPLSVPPLIVPNSKVNVVVAPLPTGAVKLACPAVVSDWCCASCVTATS